MQWTRECLLDARRQGWTVFQHGDTLDLVIGAVSDPDDDGAVVRFSRDEDALAFVVAQAARGDALARAAADYVD